MSSNFVPHTRFFSRILYIFTACVLGFLVLPMPIIILMSFTSINLLVFPPPGYSLRWYAALIQDPIWLTAAWNSLRIGITAASVATVLGTMCAVALSLGSSRVRQVVVLLMLSPVIIPVVVTAVGIFYVFARIGLSGSVIGLALAHAVIGIPFVVICVLASLQSLDRTLVRAALGLGATPWRTFWKVMLPLSLPGVVSGAVFAFATSFDDIVLVIFLGGPQQRTLPREIFAGLRENISPVIASAAVVSTLLSVLLWLVFERLQRRARAARVAVQMTS